MESREEKMTRNGDDYRGRADNVPLPEMEALMLQQVGVHPLPRTQVHFGGVIQEPIPEILVKFFIKHISSAVW